MMTKRPSLRLALSVLLLAGATGVTQVMAQRQDDAGSFMTQFPESDVYRVLVVGDAFAEGLTGALADVLQNETRVQVIRRHRQIGALVRPEWEDDIKAEEANRDPAQIVIVMTGLFDKQSMKATSTTPQFSLGSDAWKEDYGRRFERLLRAVKKRNTAVYVIGQPILRQSGQNTQAEVLSDAMRQRAAIVGAKFVDIYETFQDDSGGFSQFGPDMSGNRVKLREGDGVMLTTLGQKKLAAVVERILKRDVEQAVRDRAIPLAGDDAEQKRVNPTKAAGVPLAGWKGTVTVGARAVPLQVPVAPQAEGAGDQKADNGRITLRTVNAAGREETATIDIVRPAIPAAVIALLNRREAVGDRSQAGDGIVEDIGGGLTVVNSVASLGEIASQQAGAKRKGRAAQSAFQQVLIRGERMPPKPGRADDFTWPRPDPSAEAQRRAAAAQPASQPAQPQPRSTALPSAASSRGAAPQKSSPPVRN